MDQPRIDQTEESHFADELADEVLDEPRPHERPALTCSGSLMK